MWPQKLAISLKRRFHLLLFASSLQRSLSSRCPSRIPRSGNAADQVNCFSATIDDSEKPYLLVTDISQTHVHGKLWHQEERRYAGVIRVKLTYASMLSLKIVHYIGPDEVEYSNVCSFWLGELTRVPRLRLAIKRTCGPISRALFNQRSQLEIDRDKLLEYVISEYAVSGVDFDAGAVLTSWYNYRWYSHPGANSARKRIEFLLASLVVSGDLECKGYGRHRVLPSAFKSLSELQQVRQRHRQSICIQDSIIILTFGSLVAALSQAGIIQSPPILKADCLLENGVAKDCTIRFKLLPDKMLERVNRLFRGNQ